MAPSLCSRARVTLPSITRRFVTTKQRFYAYRGFMTVFTVGHGTRPIEELVETLAGAGVRTLVDGGRFPGSRRNPQYNQTPLAAAVEAAGIAYRHSGALRGRRSGDPGGGRLGGCRRAAFPSYALPHGAA